MKLYYKPGACSMADHIALIEAGLPYTLVKVDSDRRNEDGSDFTALNPKGYVPALELEDGTILTENLAILTYIAERSGKLLPASGLARYRALEATAFINSELHAKFGMVFRNYVEKDQALEKLAQYFAILTAQLGDSPFLVGEALTIADPYLFTMLGWAAHVGVQVSAPLTAYFARLKARPAFAQAWAEEGLP